MLKTLIKIAKSRLSLLKNTYINNISRLGLTGIQVDRLGIQFKNELQNLTHGLIQ